MLAERAVSGGDAFTTAFVEGAWVATQPSPTRLSEFYDLSLRRNTTQLINEFPSVSHPRVSLRGSPFYDQLNIVPGNREIDGSPSRTGITDSRSWKGLPKSIRSGQQILVWSDLPESVPERVQLYRRQQKEKERHVGVPMAEEEQHALHHH